MRVIIVDDERRILQDLEDMIQVYEDFQVVGTYINPLHALNEITITKPDCAFLDIEMPGISGIDLAERLLEQDPALDIVFITAFNHYATQAFEVNAMDYVLKPVHPVRFEKTIEKLIKNKRKPIISDVKEIKIRSLGYFDVLIDGIPIKWSRSKARELLAYLLHYEGTKRTKYVICEDLWPDYEPKKVLAYLQTAMCSLRKSLGTIGCEHIRIEFSDESYALYLGKVTWDVREFKRLYEGVKGEKGEGAAKEAITLYLGDYLESEDWSWSQFYRESIARRYEQLLKYLAEQRFEKGVYTEAVEIILKMAGRQPLDQKLQLLLARAAYADGGTAGLNHKVEQLRKIYFNEQGLDVEPEVLQFCIQKGIMIKHKLN